MAMPGQPPSLNPQAQSQTATLPPAAVVAEPPTLPPSVPGDAVTLPPPPAISDSETLAPRGSIAAAGTGASVPGYEIIRELGRGGMGVVYQARHLKLNRPVALKMILAGSHADAADLARFQTEAEAIARLRHPNIVQVYEVGEHEGKPYFSLEFCGGGSLEKKLNGTPLPAREAAALVETLARAMQAAHEHHVIHRDLKPANVLLTEDGTPKVTDFGLAKKLDEAGQTQSGAIMGTPSYMAPEQAGGKSGFIGPAADIYALGATLYECLTGRPPFKAATALDTIMQVVSDEPVPPTQLQPKTPRDLETICLKCLRKEPARRYESAGALAEDLGRWLRDEPIRARRAGSLERLGKWCRRRPAIAALLLVTVLATAGGLAAGSLFTLRLREINLRLRERVWQALFEQARAERLAGNRERSLEAIREAMQIKITPELREQAVLTVLGPGVRPLDEVPPDATFVPENHYRGLKIPPELPAAPRDTYCPAISADRGTAVLAQPDRDRQTSDLTAWDLKTARQVSHLGTVPGTIDQFDCCLSQDGRLFAYALYSWGNGIQPADDKVRIIDTRTGKVQAEVSRARPAGKRVDNSLAFSPDGSLLAGQLWDNHSNRGHVCVWDVTTGLTVGTMLPDSWLMPAAWSRDGRVLRMHHHPVWSNDKPVPVWEVVGPPSTHRVGRSVETLSFHPDGTRLAVNASVWDVTGERGRLRLHLSPQELPGACAVFDTAGHLWTWSEPQRWKNQKNGKHQDVTIHEVANEIQTRLTWGVRPGSDEIHQTLFEQDALGFSRDGRHLLTCRAGGSPLNDIFGIELWDPAAGRKVADWEGASELRYIYGSPMFSADGDLVACGVNHGVRQGDIVFALFIWKVSSGQVHSRLDIPPSFQRNPASVGPAVFSPDGGRVFVALTGGVAVCDIRSEAWQAFWLIRPGPDPRNSEIVPALAVSPDGRILAAGDAGGRIYLWATRTGRELACWETPDGKVMALAFSPDGQALVSGSSQGVVKLWDLPRIREGLTGLGFDWPE
jgi:eukaryotic-like serine/threonine-protein kinase